MIDLIYVWVLVIVTVTVKSALAQQEAPFVNTSLGPVQGRYIKSYEGRTVSAFEGIPYAQPPLRDLRFKEPQPVKPWTNTLKANKHYSCLQYTLSQPIKDAVGSEDCLYLYVYVPREKIIGDELLDVVVHIHGGAFLIGDPKTFSGPDYIMDRDLVYVSMNYRLGILGFISTQDEVAPGNNGLKDQVLAMKWVKNNIQAFGGNPNSITLVGSSAGASAVHYHYLSPLSAGLFNQGFSQSGTVLNSFALNKNPVENAQRVGKKFGCSLKSSKLLIQCLRQQPAKDVVLAEGDFVVLANTAPFNIFGPVVENGPNAFLPDHPYKLLLEGKIVNDRPWITSNTRDEGSGLVGFVLLYNKLQELNDRWTELAPYALDYNNTVNPVDKDYVSNIVRNHYLHDEPLSKKNIYNLVRLVTDRTFHVDAIKSVCLHSRVARAPVYYYLFDYEIEMPIAAKANLTVAGHGDDFKMLYNQIDSAPVLTESDRKMKNIFIDFLYRYASTGKPDFKGVVWPPVKYSPTEPISYIQISSPKEIQCNTAINLDPFMFWDHLPIWENEHLLPYELNPLHFFPFLY